MSTHFEATQLVGQLLLAKDQVENATINQRSIEKFTHIIQRITHLVELGLGVEEEEVEPRPKLDPDWEYDKERDRRLGL